MSLDAPGLSFAQASDRVLGAFDSFLNGALNDKSRSGSRVEIERSGAECREESSPNLKEQSGGGSLILGIPKKPYDLPREWGEEGEALNQSISLLEPGGIRARPSVSICGH
jgi:hypothetical protein